MTYGNERLARLEERVNALEEKVDSMNGKLDQLLELKFKGAGALMLASAILGSGIIGFIISISNWFGGK